MSASKVGWGIVALLMFGGIIATLFGLISWALQFTGFSSEKPNFQSLAVIVAGLFFAKSMAKIGEIAINQLFSTQTIHKRNSNMNTNQTEQMGTFIPSDQYRWWQFIYGVISTLGAIAVAIFAYYVYIAFKGDPPTGDYAWVVYTAFPMLFLIIIVAFGWLASICFSRARVGDAIEGFGYWCDTKISEFGRSPLGNLLQTSLFSGIAILFWVIAFAGGYTSIRYLTGWQQFAIALGIFIVCWLFGLASLGEALKHFRLYAFRFELDDDARRRQASVNEQYYYRKEFDRLAGQVELLTQQVKSQQSDKTEAPDPNFDPFKTQEMPAGSWPFDPQPEVQFDLEFVEIFFTLEAVIVLIQLIEEEPPAIDYSAWL